MSYTITPTVFYPTLNVEGLEIFYREAGPGSRTDSITVSAPSRRVRLSCSKQPRLGGKEPTRLSNQTVQLHAPYQFGETLVGTQWIVEGIAGNQ